jgi:hypothetical protein
MGLRELGKRLRASVEQLDDERLQERFAGLELSRIGEIEPRQPIRVGGEVQRVKLTPRSGSSPLFEITVSDGSGELTAVFTGRRHLAGVDHDRAIILEGVARKERGRTIVLNPAYTLLPDHHAE